MNFKTNKFARCRHDSGAKNGSQSDEEDICFTGPGVIGNGELLTWVLGTKLRYFKRGSACSQLLSNLVKPSQMT